MKSPTLAGAGTRRMGFLVRMLVMWVRRRECNYGGYADILRAKCSPLMVTLASLFVRHKCSLAGHVYISRVFFAIDDMFRLSRLLCEYGLFPIYDMAWFGGSVS